MDIRMSHRFLTDRGDIKSPLFRAGYMESIQKGTPPPFGERQEPLALIIFRTKKVEKSSPQENIIFRTNNIEKSRLGLIGKNFGKNLRENVSGEEKAPNLVERGRGAKI